MACSRFSSDEKRKGVPKMPWAPKRGDDFVVGKREAQRRARCSSRRGARGNYRWRRPCSFRTPSRRSPPVPGTGVLERNGVRCHGITTEPDDEPRWGVAERAELSPLT